MSTPACASIIPICCAPASAAGCCRATISSARTTIRANGTPLGTFLIANDGDGWDPDPSDPGDWIDSTDLENTLFPERELHARPE